MGNDCLTCFENKNKIENFLIELVYSTEISKWSYFQFIERFNYHMKPKSNGNSNSNTNQSNATSYVSNTSINLSIIENESQSQSQSQKIEKLFLEIISKDLSFKKKKKTFSEKENSNFQLSNISFNNEIFKENIFIISKNGLFIYEKEVKYEVIRCLFPSLFNSNIQYEVSYCIFSLLDKNNLYPLDIYRIILHIISSKAYKPMSLQAKSKQVSLLRPLNPSQNQNNFCLNKIIEDDKESLSRTKSIIDDSSRDSHDLLIEVQGKSVKSLKSGKSSKSSQSRKRRKRKNVLMKKEGIRSFGGILKNPKSCENNEKLKKSINCLLKIDEKSKKNQKFSCDPHFLNQTKQGKDYISNSKNELKTIQFKEQVDIIKRCSLSFLTGNIESDLTKLKFLDFLRTYLRFNLLNITNSLYNYIGIQKRSKLYMNSLIDVKFDNNFYDSLNFWYDLLSCRKIYNQFYKEIELKVEAYFQKESSSMIDSVEDVISSFIHENLELFSMRSLRRLYFNYCLDVRKGIKDIK